MSNQINQTICKIREIAYQPDILACKHCGQEAPAVNKARRTAIDLDLDHPVILSIKVSVHYCGNCGHYFRAQPPFIKPDAIYTNRVVARAVTSVYEDGMAIRRVSQRMARDFWVRPSEKIIRCWCQGYVAALNFETDYQTWVVDEFSGILCVDEIYQGELALLLAVDPAAVEGDRLVGYELLTENVTSADMTAFLTRLKGIGIEPEQVVSDGSSLYPGSLAAVWPQAAHQLCLFHETRRVTKGVLKYINQVRSQIPTAPPSPRKRRAVSRADIRREPSEDNRQAREQWLYRQQKRRRQIARVHDLAAQGLSQRSIARKTGFCRPTIKKWLQEPRPDIGDEQALRSPEPIPISPVTAQDKMHQAHYLAGQGLTYSEIGRQLGTHRVTIKKWLQQAPPSVLTAIILPKANFELPPPAPWQSWQQVKQIRELLKADRFLLLRRPEHLNQAEQVRVEVLLNSPIGPQLKLGRQFLLDWFLIWRDEQGERSEPAIARSAYEVWRLNPIYADLDLLRQVQQRFKADKLVSLSHFLDHDGWEATSNAAERAGRAFRHRQNSHFNLRSVAAIEASLKAEACLAKERSITPPPSRLHTCQRGRFKHSFTAEHQPHPRP